MAGYRYACGPRDRERTGHFLVDLGAWIALHAARSALAGIANQQRGNQPFDIQAVVFAHDQFTNEALKQNQHGRRLKILQ